LKRSIKILLGPILRDKAFGRKFAYKDGLLSLYMAIH